MKKKLASVLFAIALGLTGCGSGDDGADAGSTGTGGLGQSSADETSSSDESSDEASDEGEPAESGDTGSDDEAALAEAFAATQSGLNDDEIFTDDAISCYSKNLVSAFGVERLNGYGFTVDNPDDTLIPQEYEPQTLVVGAFEGCVDFTAMFEAEAGDCSLDALSEATMFQAMRYSFLLEFEEFDSTEGEAAQAELTAALQECATSGAGG